MTPELLCRRGHRFEAPQSARERAVCPLCGAVTMIHGSLETRGRSGYDQTSRMPTSGHDETLQAEHLDRTADFDAPDFAPHAIRQAGPLDTGGNENEDRSDAKCGATGAKTVAFDKTLPVESPISNSRRTGNSHDPANGTVNGKTLRFDGTLRDSDSMDDSGGGSASGDDSTASASTGAMMSPTALLQTLEAGTESTDEFSGSEQAPSPFPSSPGDSQVKPPNLPGYEVVSELGRGGMGVVYRAKHEKRNREVALKTLLHISPLELRRFKQEFRSLADIAHPNLATLYDLLSDGETWCFSMEVLEAVDFTEYVWSGFQAMRDGDGAKWVGTPLRGEPRLSAEIKRRLYEALKQLALGLNALHEAGVLHRDIKPSNVLVTTEGRVVLVDFGLASQFEEGSYAQPRWIQGTPRYMAPEQAACKPLSPASDWYAVGVMIYEILTGYFPIDGGSLEVMCRKLRETPKPPCELEPTTPRELNDLCVALLDRDQEKRPTTDDILRLIGAEDLIETLHEPARIGCDRTLELVGREAHLKGLHASFRQVTGGISKTIFVRGKSGMGKSVLIQKFLGDIREQDLAVVLSGRCYEQESVPFKALDSLIDSLAVHLAGLPESELRAVTPDDLLPLIRLFPVLGQIPGASDPRRPSIENVDQQEVRQRAMNALRELLNRLGKRKPMVLYIDDLQWGDEDSADLLADLMRPPEAPRVLVLGAYRAENRETSFCLRALDKAYATGQQHPHREEIAVDSLAESDAKRLALMLLGRHDSEGQALAAKIARESGGWPFFVWELAQHVQDSPETADRSLELDEVIWARVHRLPLETRRLLELVAVTGRPIPVAEAYQAINAPDKGPSFLAQLRTRNFVRTTDAEDDETIVEIYHDRIRESVVAHLNREAVKRYSLQLAIASERASGIQVADLWTHIRSTADYAEPGTPYTLERHRWQRVFDQAYFFDAAGEHGRAFPFALVAAEQARKQDAQEVAEQQYRIALRGVRGVSPALRFRVLEGLGDVLVLRGRYDDANEQFRAARELATGNLVLARIDGKLGASARKKGNMGDAVEYLERALTALGEQPPRHFPSLLFAVSKEIFVQMLHTLFPSRFTGRKRFDAPQAATDLFRARLYDDLTFTYWFSRGTELCLWSHLRQMNLAERYTPSQELGRTYAFHAITMTAIPMARRGIRYAEKAYEISRRQGNLWGQGQARSFHTFACIVLARFKEGVAMGTEAVRLLEQAGDVWEANMARMIAAVPMYHLGDLKAAYRESKKAYEIGVECGDYSAVCISLAFWIPAAPHTIPRGAIQAELKREREDPLSIGAALYARGLELLFCEDKPQEAADVFQQCLDGCKKRGLRNVCIFGAVSWKATACRIVAERADGPRPSREAIAQAHKAARAALKITKSYLAYRPHALREAGIVAAMRERPEQAREFFERSLAVAEQFDARYDHARTLLARGEAGLKFGWPAAETQIAQAQAAIAEIENVEEE